MVNDDSNFGETGVTSRQSRYSERRQAGKIGVSPLSQGHGAAPTSGERRFPQSSPPWRQQHPRLLGVAPLPLEVR